MSTSRTHPGLRDEPHGKGPPDAIAFPDADLLDNVKPANLLLLILILAAATVTACLRLTPSERLDEGSDPTSTEPDASSSSDTPYIDTDFPCDKESCPDRPDTRSCTDGGMLTIVAGDCYCVLDTDSMPEYRFDTEQLDCPLGSCEGAEHCKDAPCHGVRCHSPPWNECLDGSDGDSDGSGGTKLRVYERVGRCQPADTDGEPCVYDIAKTIDCTNGCDTDTVTGAHCVEEPCQAVVCNRPPARYCADDNRLVVWNLYGRCDEYGSCVYDSRIIDCPAATGGCQNGRCVANPCDGVLCRRPPARYCSTAATVVDFDPVGTCDTAGACVYDSRIIDCSGAKGGCQNGRCVNDPCDGVLCHNPPAPYCNAEGRLIFWDALERCASGSGRCTYRTDYVTCDPTKCRRGRCEGGGGGDPCAGPPVGWLCKNGAPAVYCADENQAMVPSPNECESSNPSCDYSPVPQSCPGGCQAGVCEQSSSALPVQGCAR